MVNLDLWFLLFFADVFLLSFTAIFAFFSYYKKLGELKMAQTDTQHKAQQVIEEAKKQAESIIETVEHKADEILSHSELFKNDLDDEFKTSLKKSGEKYLEMVEQHSKRFITDYEQVLNLVKNQSLEKAGKALDNIEQEIKKSLDESKSAIKTELMKSLGRASAEIEEYKKSEMEKIDRRIDDLVIQLAKELLRLNLTPKDHNKLVIQALEKAKEQGTFFL